MHKYNKALGVTALAAGMVFGAAAQAEQATDWNSWHDNLDQSMFITDARNQCVSMADPSVANPATRAKVEHVLSILERTPFTARGVESMRAQEAAVCFVDFAKEISGDMTVAALRTATFNAIVVNDGPTVAEGCVVSAMIHESHHATQSVYGYEPIRDLTKAAQEDMVMGIEADAHAVQITGSWLLARADQPYAAAEDCNKTTLSADIPHFARALHAFEAAIAADTGALESGAATGAAYRSSLTDYDLFQRYSWGISDMYNCEYNPECFRERHTLEGVGVDMTVLAAIHYSGGAYETPLFTPFRADVLAQRDQPRPLP
jgi:hypothetical protein